MRHSGQVIQLYSVRTRVRFSTKQSPAIYIDYCKPLKVVLVGLNYNNNKQLHIAIFIFDSNI